jgi:hypothetical protein
MKYLFQIIILFKIISFIWNVNKITFNLERGEELCLSEYFADKTSVIYEINSDFKIGFEIFEPEDKMIIIRVN